MNKIILVPILALALGACGGGDGDGTKSNGSIAYSGKTTPITLTESTYDAMTNNISDTAGNTDTINSFIENNHRSIRSTLNKSKLFARESSSHTGNCGGSVVINTSPQASTVVLNNYCNSEAGLKIEGNGSISLIGNFANFYGSGYDDGAAPTPKTRLSTDPNLGSITASNFIISVTENNDKSTLAVDGKISFNFSESTQQIATTSFIIKSNKSEVGDIKFENFIFNSSENASQITASLDGNIYFGNYGLLTFETVVPLQGNVTADNPTAGTLRIKGNNSTVKLQANASGEVCTASLDGNGDGTFETPLNSCNLDDFLNKISTTASR